MLFSVINIDQPIELLVTWNEGEDFLQDLQNQKVADLREFLIETKLLQSLFLAPPILHGFANVTRTYSTRGLLD